MGAGRKQADDVSTASSSSNEKRLKFPISNPSGEQLASFSLPEPAPEQPAREDTPRSAVARHAVC